VSVLESSGFMTELRKKKQIVNVSAHHRRVPQNLIALE
jgi:hypothetical protein